jgi:hypothetical protein
VPVASNRVEPSLLSGLSACEEPLREVGMTRVPERNHGGVGDEAMSCPRLPDPPPPMWCGCVQGRCTMFTQRSVAWRLSPRLAPASWGTPLIVDAVVNWPAWRAWTNERCLV